MQLRSGKNTCAYISKKSGYRSRVYENPQCENITIKAEMPSSGKHISSITKHSMILRSSCRPAFSKENVPEPMHFAEIVSARLHSKVGSHDVFLNWLIDRIQKLLTAFFEIDKLDPKPRILEHLRILAELIDVMYEHIDYITSSEQLCRISSIIFSKMVDLSKQITFILNGNPNTEGIKCEYTDDERAFMGNVRADTVKLAVMIKNRL